MKIVGIKIAKSEDVGQFYLMREATTKTCTRCIWMCLSAFSLLAHARVAPSHVRDASSFIYLYFSSKFFREEWGKL